MEKHVSKRIIVAFGWIFLLSLLCPGKGKAGEPEDGVKFSGEVRIRPEGRDNADFNSDIDDTDFFVGQRTRLGVSATFKGHYRGVLQIQDVRNWGEEAKPGSNEKNVDLYEGYLELFDLPGHMTVRIGRQELKYGNERLVGAFNWSNGGRTFDALLVRFAPEKVKLDLFAAQYGRRKNVAFLDASGNPVTDDQGNPRSDPLTYDALLGAYATLGFLPHTDLELYFFHRADGTNETTDQTRQISSPGLRVNGKIKGFSYTLEGATQFGDNRGMDHSAYALAVVLGYTLPAATSPYARIEYDMASGDDDPTDAKSKEFDNFFPTNHGHYGFIDYIGWRNMQDIHATVGLHPMERLNLRLDYHNLALMEVKGRWSNAGGKTIVGADASRSGSKYLGDEIDFTLIYKSKPKFSTLLGYSVFLPGSFAKANRGSDASSFGYLMLDFKF